MVTNTITLGNNLTVNRIGYGAMHLTGPGFWGRYPDPDHAVQVLRRAVDLGGTFIDTADSHGPATNELLIARALHPYPENLVISTKGGMVRTGPRDWANSRNHQSRPPTRIPPSSKTSTPTSPASAGTPRTR